MRKKKKILLLELFILVLVIVVAIVVCIYFSSPITINNDTSIETKTAYVHSKETVEENATSLIELYKSDFAIFAKNKDTNKEVAEEARIRANSTAEYYNKYIQNNSYLWGDDIPDGIVYSLPIIK